MTKVLFINPTSISRDALPIPPLGILYLAAYIRQRGYTEIKVIDNNYSNLTLEELKVEILNYDVICVTGTTSQYPQAQSISRIAKSQNKISIIGGPHASALPEETLMKSDFDYVVLGEGEVSLYELLLAIHGKKQFDYVNGIAFIKGYEPYISKERELIDDLDILPFPARDLIPIHNYGNISLKRFNGRYTHVMSSRGCGSKCTFCSSPSMWGRPRFMMAKRVFSELLHINREYGISNIHFQDDNFTAERQRVIDICQLIINSGIEFKWSCQARPDKIDFELLQQMKAAGCVQIEYGVESGDKEILKRSKKGYTKEQIRNSFFLAKKAGIATYGFFIVGLPGETIMSCIKTIFFAKQLQLDGCFWSVLTPYPGTEIYSKKLVNILKDDYCFWLYKKPVVMTGYLGPRLLSIMRWIADKSTNGLFNNGTYIYRRNLKMRKIS